MEFFFDYNFILFLEEGDLFFFFELYIYGIQLTTNLELVRTRGIRLFN